MEHQVVIHIHKPIEDSYSRHLDMVVQAQEMPYGYDSPPPPADSGNYDQKAKESRKEYKPKRR